MTVPVAVLTNAAMAIPMPSTRSASTPASAMIERMVLEATSTASLAVRIDLNDIFRRSRRPPVASNSATSWPNAEITTPTTYAPDGQMRKSTWRRPGLPLRFLLLTSSTSPASISSRMIRVMAMADRPVSSASWVREPRGTANTLRRTSERWTRRKSLGIPGIWGLFLTIR